MTRLKIGVLVDRMRLARWQLEALRTLANTADFHVYSCANPRSERRRLRYALYYLLNLFTIRNRLTRSVPLPDDLPPAALTEFEVEHDGSWQALPRALLDRVRVDDVAVVIKFGLGLLRVPPELDVPILSYHHGDPAQFRGRPAGFYEMLEDAPVLGQVVQRLSNTLDAGDILAFAETKVRSHSYHATLVEAFRRSPLILKRAVMNCLDGGGRRPEQIGANRRLPPNGLVLRFVLKVWRQAAQRILYGLFREKLWCIATVRSNDDPTLDRLAETLGDRASWRPVPAPPAYRFLADPFFHPEGGLLVEALNSYSSRGEILRIDDGEASKLSNRGGHYSYPAIIRDHGRQYVVPEISDWSSAKAFALENQGLGDPIELKIPGRPRLLDPTPFEHEGLIYLFGNATSDGASVLRLWFADSMLDEFREHPCSPIRISPNGGRMGGSLHRRGNRLFRFGQDDRRSYGDGLTAFEVVELDARRYREVAVRSFRFAHCCGPHTLNFGHGRATFDFYVERSSLLAGLRRWRHRRAARTTD